MPDKASATPQLRREIVLINDEHVAIHARWFGSAAHGVDSPECYDCSMTARGSSRNHAAALRATTMVIRKSRLGQPEADFSPVSKAAAISLLTQLTRESFSLAGIDVPDARDSPVSFRFIARNR